MDTQAPLPEPQLSIDDVRHALGDQALSALLLRKELTKALEKIRDLEQRLAAKA